MGSNTRDRPKLKPAAGGEASRLSQGPRERVDTALTEELRSVALLIRVQETLAVVVQGYKILIFTLVCLGK